MPIKLIDSEVHIQKVLTFWRAKFLHSPLIISDSNGVQRIDIQKAREHLKFVWLCKVLFSDLSIYNPKATYVKAHTKSLLKSERVKRCFEYANKLIDELEITFSVDDLIDDFNTDRTILKQSFKTIFRSHGIILNSKILDAFFGARQDQNTPTKTFDSICEFTAGTGFHKPLRLQFGTTLDMTGDGIFSIFFMRAAGTLDLKGYRYQPIKEDESKFVKDLSPLWSESKITRILIRAALSTYQSPA